MTAGSGFVPVIDDDAMNRLAAVRRPRARRAACGWWGIGAGTQGALRDELFDCVPLDVLMPELDGYQVLDHVRSDPSQSGTRW
jgi:CheY-like chemotaxis protein